MAYRRLLFLLLVAGLAQACDCSGNDALGRPCNDAEPCPGGLVCSTDGVCVDPNAPLPDGGGGGGGTDPLAELFDRTPVTDAARDAEILYPLDEAVMPQNVMPADVQWACGADAAPCDEDDVFRVTLSKPDLTIVNYVSNAQVAVNDHRLVNLADWRALAQANPAAQLTITVDRYDASSSEVVAGTSIQMTFAAAAVTGTVYYWDIDDRTIRKIDDGSAMSSILIAHPQSPNASENDPNNPGNDCVGCHTISPSGRYMLANLDFQNYGALYDLTRADLGANPAPTEWAASTDIRWRTATFNPAEDRAMVSGAGDPEGLRLINPFTGATLSTSGEPLPSPGTMPAWAPDNSKVAYVSGGNSWAGQITNGDISLIPVNGVDDFGASAPRHDGGALSAQPEGGTTDSYPTWSPDSGYLAFAHGTGSRSDPRDADGSVAVDPPHTSALYLMGGTSGAPMRLDNANGDEMYDFQPRFSPFESGGYYWLSFLSRRPYGNRTAGNAGTGDDTPSDPDDDYQPGQIWITAVQVNPDGSVDPSRVPYWVPGQVPTHRSVSAYWAARACRGDGEDCSVDSECCTGECAQDSGGNYVCSPAQVCRDLGETCSTGADCCGYGTTGVSCTNNVCVEIFTPQ